jgi:hypothetical protein
MSRPPESSHDLEGEDRLGEVDEILDSLHDAICLIATAASALDYAGDCPGEDDPADTDWKVRCLTLGVKQLSRVRIEVACALEQHRRRHEAKQAN